MTRRPVTGGFVFQAASLVIAAIVVHALYVTVVWPRAASDQAAFDARMQVDPTFVPERSIWIILRDYEQESEIVLMLWGLAIIAQKALTLRREQSLFGRELVALGEGMRILPEDVAGHARTLQSLPEPEKSALLPRALLAALHRFGATGSISDASASAHNICEGEADRLDSELSLLRYVAWAIPAIGFIGTVRGIGDALAQAHRAMQGDLSGVTAGLGTAFNSTLIALLLSLILMFLLHHLQSEQERLVRDAESYLDERLLLSLRAA
jgi:biopolymer transport protein ExbB/TolQ